MLMALLFGRCPRCKQGHIFRRTLAGIAGDMNDACEVCELKFLRETGYFLGAMYLSYGLGVATVLPVAVVLALVIEWPVGVVLVLSGLQTLISAPLFLRYSRVLWLWLDQRAGPR